MSVVSTDVMDAIGSGPVSDSMDPVGESSVAARLATAEAVAKCLVAILEHPRAACIKSAFGTAGGLQWALGGIEWCSEHIAETPGADLLFDEGRYAVGKVIGVCTQYRNSLRPVIRGHCMSVSSQDVPIRAAGHG